MRGPALAPPRFIALGFPERVMRCVRVLVQKKSDAVGITLSANPCTGARVACYASHTPRCPIFRYSQKQFHDTITARICQAANWPPIMTLTGRELRPCWPGITAVCRLHDFLNVWLAEYLNLPYDWKNPNAHIDDTGICGWWYPMFYQWWGIME